MSASSWAVTTIAHRAVRDVSDDCPDCLALAPHAANLARASGSTGGTQTVGAHSATVVRAIAVLTL